MYICGGTDGPTIADCALVPLLARFKSGGVDHVPATCLDAYPVVLNYFDRFMALPEHKGVVCTQKLRQLQCRHCVNTEILAPRKTSASPTTFTPSISMVAWSVSISGKIDTGPSLEHRDPVK